MNTPQIASLATKNESVLSEYTSEQVSIIRSHCANSSFTDSELAYCLHVSRARGLDPLKRQIYFTKRTKKSFDGGTETALTVEPTIDGFRSLADSTGELDGYDGPYWCGEDGEWREVWTSKQAPVASKIVVYRKNVSRGFVGIATFDAYAQRKHNNDLNHAWSKMGPHMLSKCAESLALRKAFPQTLSGLYTREEMGEIDSTPRHAIEVVNAATDAKQLQPKLAQKVVEAPPEKITVLPAELMIRQLAPLAGKNIDELSVEELELLEEASVEFERSAKTETGRTWFAKIHSAVAEQLLHFEDVAP